VRIACYASKQVEPLLSAADPDYDRFVIDHFDSEEAVMIVLALRGQPPLSPADIAETLEKTFHVGVGEDRRLTEKRVELRLRDLVSSELLERTADGTYRYRGDERGVDEFVERMDAQFTTRRSELNRLIYSSYSRARKLAEAFRL
jgi:hypothetical protein